MLGITVRGIYAAAVMVVGVVSLLHWWWQLFSSTIYVVHGGIVMYVTSVEAFRQDLRVRRQESGVVVRGEKVDVGGGGPEGGEGHILFLQHGCQCWIEIDGKKQYR